MNFNRWGTTFNTLFSSLGNKELSEYFDILSFNNGKYSTEPIANEIEPTNIVLLRSLKQQLVTKGFHKTITELQLLSTILNNGIIEYLPSKNEFETYVTAPFKSLISYFPHFHTGLSISNPVSHPERISINIVSRSFDSHLNLD